METNGISLIEIVFGGAFGIGFLKLLWDIYVWLRKRVDDNKKIEEDFKKEQIKIEKLFNDLITNSVRIQELIEELVELDPISRVLVFKLENGGGTPQLGTVQHMSILYEAIKHKYNPESKIYAKHIKQDFQSYVIGADYQKMLMELMRDGKVIKNTDQVDVGIIRNTYESLGVQKSIIIPIIHIPEIGCNLCKGFLIYMGIHLEKNCDITPEMEMRYEVTKQKIEKIYQEFYLNQLKNFQ